MPTQTSRTLRTSLVALVLAAGLSCSKDEGPIVPTDIELASGNSQTAAAGEKVSVAPSVRVTDAKGKPVSGVDVTFAVTGGGGTVGGATQQTDGDGVAIAGSWTLGTTAGTNTLSATSGSLTGSPVVFTATGIPGAPANAGASVATTQTAAAGSAVSTPPSIRVTDAHGNFVSGVSVTFAVASGGGSITGATQTTSSSGVATVGSWTLGTTVGSNTLTASASGVSGSITFTATGIAGAASIIASNAGNNQTAASGAAVAVAPSVKITDANGNPVAGTVVTFSVQSGGGTVSGATPASNSSGIATVGSWTLGTAGANTLRATVTGLTGSPITFTATATAGPATTIAANSGNNQTAAPGTAVGTPPSVKVSDAGGNGVSGVSVTFSVFSGGGSITGATQTTNGSGIATVGSWTLGATAGANTLRATATGLTGSPVTFTATGSATACPESAIAVGETKTGSLATTDCKFDDGSYVDLYRLSIAASTNVQIDLTSAAFDAYLIIANAGGSVVTYDDDGGGGTNSRVTVSLAPGEYTISASSYAAAEVGAYSLAVAVGGASCITAGNITLGTPGTGSLTTSDCKLNDGRYTDPWSFTLSSATTVRVGVDATFDTYAYLTKQDGSVIDEDDDSGTGTNALIETTLQPGTYYVWATSIAVGVTGSYSVSVASAGASCSAPTTLTLGTPAAGTLANTDCTFSGGSYTDPYRFTTTADGQVKISMTSAAFDAYLVLANSAGTVVATDDDGGEGTNSLLTVTLAAGTYTVWATSYPAAATGAYQITATTLSSGCQSNSAIATGQSLTGTLATTDCQLSDGSYVDRWSLTLSATTAVTVDLTSSAFDAYLYIENSTGTTVATDDDGGGGTNSRIQITLDAGTYTIYANSYSAGQTGAYTLAVAGGGGGGGGGGSGTLNLVIDRLYLTQSTQTLTGGVPLVAGRDALLRVFARANQTNTATPAVRVRFYNSSGTLLDTRTITAPGSSVPTSLNEGTLISTWNYVVPATLVQPGLKIVADVDPTNAITESSDADNSFPTTGMRTIDVRSMPQFNITLIPVRQSVNNRTGNVTTANGGALLAMTRSIWPIVTIDARVRATYTTDLPALQSGDQNGSWGALLSEINAIRAAEAPGRYYYGVLNVSYNAGIAGLGYIGRAASMGWDYNGSAGEVMAHELGHNFGRRHAPCGNPGGPDANYPYSGGAIGVSGYDVAAASLKSASQPDIMAYCSNPWISDYTYRGAMDFLKTAAAISEPTESLLLWGRVDGRRLVLEPAVEMTARPTPTPASGAYRLEGFDAEGKRVLNIPFDPDEVSEELTSGSRHFAFVIPKRALGGAELVSLRLTRPGLVAAELRTSAAANMAVQVAPPAAMRAATGDVRVTWDATVHPMAVVRSARTGEILSFARSGAVSVPTTETELDVILTDGVRSVTRRVVPR